MTQVTTAQKERSRWIYKIKHNLDGTIECYKVCLIAQDYNQVQSFDYNKTFAPVVEFATIKCLIAMATFKKWESHQLNVNNVFLNGDLKEEAFMPIIKGMVCQLHKSLWLKISLVSMVMGNSLTRYSLMGSSIVSLIILYLLWLLMTINYLSQSMLMIL